MSDWMTSEINNPLVLHCFLVTMALTGMEPAVMERKQKLKGGPFKFVTTAPKHEGN